MSLRVSRHSFANLAPLVLTLAPLLLAVGCSGGQVKPSADQPSAAADGALTIVGWSLRDQSPLGVQGVVRGEGAREIGAFDTRVEPARGKTFANLPAGHYRIEITHRAAGDRTIVTAAADELDVQPGQRLRREVVVDDREVAGAVTAQSGAEH